jgi:hypothetical protein
LTIGCGDRIYTVELYLKETGMLVAKWGNSLASPAAAVEALELKGATRFALPIDVSWKYRASPVATSF